MVNSKPRPKIITSRKAHPKVNGMFKIFGASFTTCNFLGRDLIFTIYIRATYYIKHYFWAFLPEEDVCSAFDELLDSFPEEGLPVANYFEDTFIGRRRRDGRSVPTFPISFWSVYFRVLENLPRTTNNVEAWHRGLQSNIACKHPNWYKFLGALQKEQALTEFKLARIDAGNEPDARKSKYENLDRRIYSVVSRYDSQDKLQYLRSLSYSFSI